MYPPEFNDRLKNSIRERDRWTCAICGDPGVHVHHINYIKEDCHELNLITLCERCHPVTNGNRGEWRRYLTKIVVTRPRLEPKQKRRKPRKRRKRRFTSPRQYAQHKRAEMLGAALDDLNIKSYCVVMDEASKMYRGVLTSNEMPYLLIPQSGGTSIVISPLGAKKMNDDVVQQLYDWMMVEDRAPVSTSGIDV